MRKLSLFLCACAMAGTMGAQQQELLKVASRAPQSAAAAAPAATDVHYALPDGCFYFGDWIRDRYYFNVCTSVIAPAHATIHFANDGKEGDSYRWTYSNPTDYSYSISNMTTCTADTRDLTFASECYNYGYMPTLATTVGGTTTEYSFPPYSDNRKSFFQIGGRPGDFYHANQPGLQENGFYGFMQYDFRGAYVNLYANGAMDSFVFGKGAETEREGITGFVSMFHKPAAPYVLKDGIKVSIGISCDDDAEITVTLRKATKVSDTEYDLGAEIGHATLTVAQIKVQMAKYAIGDDYIGWLHFADFVMTNEEGDDVSILPATIDTALAVVFTGWNNTKVSKFEIFTNEQILKSNGTYDSLANSRIETSTFFTGGTYGKDAKAKYEHFVGAVSLGAFFPILHPETDSYNATAEGGTQTVKVDRYQYMATEPFSATCDAEWVTVTTASTSSTRTWCGSLTVTVAPNESTEARSAVVTLTDTDGSRSEFVVNQEANLLGVEGVAAAGSKAFVVGNTLSLRGVNGTVRIFNAAGSLVMTTTAGGDASVSVAGLASGIYFVSLPGGSCTRFVK